MKTVERWRRDAPENFEFVIKASQFITHQPSSPTYRRSKIPNWVQKEDLGAFQWNQSTQMIWQYIRDIVRTLRGRMVIFQSPKSFTPEPKHIKNFKRFFNEIDRSGLILGWESRCPWPHLNQILSELEIIDVVDPFERDPVSGQIGYYRIHGGQSYRKKFSDTDLTLLAKRIKRISYVMFNNITMFDDASRFLKLIER